MMERAPGAQAHVDTRALEKAAQLEGRLDAHVQETARRYAEQTTALRDLRAEMAAQDAKRSQGFDRLYEKLDEMRREMARSVARLGGETIRWRQSVYVGLIALLLALVGFLAVNGRPWVAHHQGWAERAAPPAPAPRSGR